MKKLILLTIVSILIIFNTIGQEIYKVSPENSKIEWIGEKITSAHSGYINLQDAFFIIEEEKFVGGEFNIDMNTIKCTDIENPIYAAKLEEHLKDPNSQKGYILDGYPRNLQQVDDLNSLLKKLGQNINVAISITAEKEELISRLIKRKKDSGRSDDDAKIISKRQDVYWNQTAPIIDHYKKVNLLKEIDGLGSIKEVTQRILKVINL